MHDGDDDGVSALGGEGAENALTCGINTNMCAALLHVVSDLARSTTTLVESIILLNVPSIAPTVADGVSTLVVCSIIVIGATGALLTWLREVHIFVVAPAAAPAGAPVGAGANNSASIETNAGVTATAAATAAVRNPLGRRPI